MKSYQTIKAQIEKLEREAESLRQRELKSVIAQVRRTIEQYELTPADLGLGGAATVRSGKRVARKGSRGRATVGVAKFRDPATGKTWTGRGRPPTWMIGVKDPSAYLISGASAAPAAAQKKAKPGRKVARKTQAAAKPARKAAKKSAPAARRGKAKANGKASMMPAEGNEAKV